MFFLFSKKIKFILKSISYYFAFLSPVANKLLARYLEFEQHYFFKNADEIDFPILKDTTIKLRKDSFLTSLILNDFEHDELAFLKKILDKGDVVFDIGANIGIYTLLSSRYVGEFGVVYAFEPSPNSYKKLNSNIAQNKLVNVNTKMLAVSDSSNQLLSLYENINGYDALSNLIQPISDTDIITKVKTITLDDFILNEKVKVNKIKFVKVDVEGWEIHVLQGAKSLLNNLFPIVFMVEFSDVNLKDKHHTAASIYEFMVTEKFEWYQFNSTNNKLEFSPLRNYYEPCNLIAVNKIFKELNPIFFK